MVAIVAVCAAFDLTVAESETESVHLRESKGVAEVLTIEVVGQR